MVTNLQDLPLRSISAHAAGAPQNGRSALDGVEAMNMMVNMMREHMDEEARIHYVITKNADWLLMSFLKKHKFIIM